MHEIFKTSSYHIYFMRRGGIVLLCGGDPAYIVHALGVVARARNMSKLTHNAGMSREGLYKALSGTGNPSFSTVVKVAAALGLRINFTASRSQENVRVQPV